MLRTILHAASRCLVMVNLVRKLFKSITIAVSSSFRMSVGLNRGILDAKAPSQTGRACLRLEAVLQADAAVEDQAVGVRVLAVQAEVTQTHKLEASRSLRAGQGGLDLAVFQHL